MNNLTDPIWVLSAIPTFLYGAGAAILVATWAAGAWGRAWLADLRRRRERHRHQTAVQELITLLAADPGMVPSSTQDQTPGAAQAQLILTPLSLWSRYEVVTQVVSTISGHDLEAARHLTQAAGLTDHARSMLDRRRWDHRLRGVALLAGLAIDDDRLPTLLDDPRPVVRAAAARWIARLEEVPSHAPSLIALLGDDNGVVRLAARDAFTGAGVEAVPPLVESLTTGLQHLSHRQILGVLEIAHRVHAPELLEVALPLADHDDLEIAAAATRLLSQHSDPNDELARRADHPAHQIRQAAVAAAAERGDPRCARWVGHRASEPDWRVSGAAIVALGRLGAPGDLIIRNLARRRAQPDLQMAVAS